MTAPTPLHRSYRFGRWTVHELQAGGQQLDGGAMFGVVPKVLWERRLAADERNRIPMGMRCLLIEHEDGLVLVDTGAGAKETPKFYEIYGVENGPPEGDPGPTALEAAIRIAGFTPPDVSLVVNTHLHFDHAGGNTVRDEDGTIRAAFPNARYVVQKGEYHYASNANERTTASYFPPNYDPLLATGAMELIEGPMELRPGLSVLPTPGHTPHHQSVVLDAGGGDVLCFLGDIVPTQWHLPLPWIMGYDVEPLVSLETKRWLLARAVEEEWLVMFEHDAHTATGRVGRDGKGYHLLPESSAS